MTTLARRSSYRPINPLSLAGWHTAFWASDPDWSNPGNGNAVSTWRDGSGGGHDASQATSSKRPIYRSSSAGMNNRPVVEFDGVDDFLQTASFTGLAQANEIIVIGRFRSLDATTRMICDGIASGNRHRATATSSVWGIYAGIALTGGTPDTSGHLIRPVFSGTDTLDIDATNVISGNAGTNTITGVTLGSAFDGASGFAPVDIAFYGLFDAGLGADIRASMLAFSRAYYGTP